MRRGTSRDTGDRVGIGATRLTVTQADDKPLMQELALKGFHREQMDTIEHAHPYGFTALPKKAAQGDRKKAEAFVVFLNGNRSHGVALVVSDRRYRPNNLQEGEVVVHDDGQQQVYVSRDRVLVNSDKEVHVQRGDAHVLLTNGKLKLSYGAMTITTDGQKIWLGKEGVLHAVMTSDGPSEKVFCVINETDGPVTAAAIAKRTEASSRSGG